MGRDAELRERAREVLEARACARHAKSPSPRAPGRSPGVGGPVFKTGFDSSATVANKDKRNLSWRRGRVSGAALLGARGGMPSIWRPNVRVTLDEDGEVEDTEGGGEEVTKKGTKRKRAPRTKGPCEHGVKYRSNCKVCSACPHGRERRFCKECGGASICEHGRIRSRCKECRAADY